MKRLIIAAVALLSLFSATAQNVDFFVKGGIGGSSWNGEDSGGTCPKFSYRIGAGLEKHIKGIWGFETGLYFSSAGVKMDADSGDTGLAYDLDGTINQLYIEIPLMATITAPFGSRFKLTLAAGPYLAVGVGGKYTASVDLGGGHSVSEKVNTFGSIDDGKDFKSFCYRADGRECHAYTGDGTSNNQRLTACRFYRSNKLFVIPGVNFTCARDIMCMRGIFMNFRDKRTVWPLRHRGGGNHRHFA